jgi:histidine ammonia-lyase
VYGITTGFADLRNISVNPERSAELSRNLILSHDAAIGDPLPDDITLGAMLIRANTLAKGHSGFSVEGIFHSFFLSQSHIPNN